MINIENMITVSKLLHCKCFVKTRLDKSSTVVVELASFVGNPVAGTKMFQKDVLRKKKIFN